MCDKVFKYVQANGSVTAKTISKALLLNKNEVESACEFFVANGLFAKRVVKVRPFKKISYYFLEQRKLG